MWWSTRCIRSDPGWISGREPIARPGSGTAKATSRHARTPAAPEPTDLEAVAQGLRRGGGAGRRPAPRRRARAAGFRSGAVQVGENPVDHSGLGSEGDDAHPVSAPGTPERVELKIRRSSSAQRRRASGSEGGNGLGLPGRGRLVGARPAPNAAGPVGVPAIVALEHLALVSHLSRLPLLEASP